MGLHQEVLLLDYILKETSLTTKITVLAIQPNMPEVNDHEKLFKAQDSMVKTA